MAILSKGTTYSDGDQVTSTNLNALVDSATFASDAVDDSTTQLSSGAIIVKDLGISAGKLATSAVTTAKIAGSNVTTAKIAAANITTSLIADSNVTKAKIENLANYKVLGNVSGGAAAPAEVALLDEDNMSSNSATSLATQQSIKAYVDTKLTAEDLDFAGDSGSSSVDLDSQTFTIAGATGLDTAASGQTLTVSLDFNEISNAAIADGDFIPFVDATDSTTKKEAIADIATLFAGTGLSASSSVLSVDASQTQITSVGTLGAGAISSGFGAIDNGSSAITTTGVGSFGSLDISGNVDVDGTLETDALSIASTAVTSTAAELNYNDTGAAVGTVVASKTVTVDSNKDVSSFRNITLTGELDAATLDISGNTDIDGVTTLNSTAQLNSTLTVGINGNGHDVKFFGDTSGAYIQFDASADKLLTAGGATVDIVKDKLLIGGTAVTTTAAELNILDGVTSTTAELNILDGVTSTAAELNYLDITTLGTSEASKAVTVDSNGDLLVPDSDKFKFGTGSDMQVYHDGTNSYIANSTGELKLATETSGIAIAIGHSTSEATFGDNVTITGNLTINGTTTTVNTTNLTVTDPLVKFGEGYTGSAFDEGFIVTRGNGSASNTANKGFIWDETADEFAAIACNTEDGTTAGNVTINSYADLQVGKLTGGSLDISGAIDVAGTTNLDVVDIDGAVDIATTLAVAGNVDFNGDLDVDGTANLDVVDIDGAVDMASTLAVAGKVSAGANAQFGASLGQFNGANVAISNSAGQLSIGSTNTAAADLGGSLGFTANTTSLTGYPMGNISGRLIAAGAGVYRSYMAFATTNAGGTVAERMRLTDTGLDIAGNIDVDGTTNLDVVDIDGAVQIDSTLTVGVNDTGHDVKFFGATSGAYMHWDESTDDLILGGVANLGIGTTAPTSKLSFGANIGNDFAVYEGSGGANKYGIGMGGDGSGGDPYRTKLYSNGTELISMTSAGNVGIGTATPTYKLDVNGTGRFTGNVQMDGTVTVGVDDTGKDVKFFGATSGSYMMWDESVNTLSTIAATFDCASAFGVPKVRLKALSSRGSIDLYNEDANSSGRWYYDDNGSIFKLYNTDDGSEEVRVQLGTDGSDDGYVSVYSAAGAKTIDISGDGSASFSGAVSKGSGSFNIKHPLESKKDTHRLVHSFIEGPQADLIYRGRVDLVDGSAEIDIDTVSGMTDGTFVVLCRDIQSFTTNESGWTAVRSSVDGNILTIEAQDNTCTDSISWMVVGERQDEHMYETEWTDENGKVIVEPLIPPPPPPEPEEEELEEEITEEE